MNHQFFFTYTRDNTKFIHCDVWGHAWLMQCPSNLVWNQQGQTCIENTHTSSNPCTQDQVDKGITMFPHQDPHKYIHCDNALNPWVQSCNSGTVFDFASQNCVWDTSASIVGWSSTRVIFSGFWYERSSIYCLWNYTICTY